MSFECLPLYDRVIDNSKESVDCTRVFSRELTMNVEEEGDILNAVFLCIINISFMVAGIFLNSVVIISLWRSRQLRKQVRYFMILVLSCFDLAVVSITHPFLIASTIYYFLQEVNEMLQDAGVTVFLILCGLSLSTLFMLNVERFLAITCPYFHQRSVTKTNLVCFQAFMTILVVGVSSSVSINTQAIIAVNIISVLYMSLLLFLFMQTAKYIQSRSQNAATKGLRQVVQPQ